MLIDPLDDPLMHEHDLRLPADLWMDTHGEHERVVFAVQEGKLILPEPLDHVRIHVTVRRGLLQTQLERRPVIQMPVGRHFDNTRGLDGRHGLHPFRRGLGHVRLGPILGSVRAVVQLRIVVHERVVVFDAELFQELDGLFGRRPRRCRPAFRMFAREVGQHLDGFAQDVLLLLLAQSRHEFVRIAMQATGASGTY